MDEEIKKLIESIVTKDGLKVSGNGIVIKKLEKIVELVDKTNLKLFYLEKRLDEIKEKI